MRIDRKIIDDLNTKTHPKEKAKFQPITVEGQTPFYTPDTTQKTPVEAPKTSEKTESAQTGTGTMGMPTISSAKKNDASFSYGAYTESDAVKKAKEALDQKLANAPGAYESSWQKTIDDTIEKIMNREKFSYDVNGDALYQQYKDQFTRQGKLAMQDSMGQAAAMTGGYGNSYAATVGNQAYQQSMQDLGNVIPELYQLAYERYAGETRDLYDQYALLGDRENIDYGRYRDEVSDHQVELNRLQNQYNAEREFDYGKYADDRNFDYGVFENDRAFAYQQERDAVADAQWQKNFDEALRQYEESKSQGQGTALAHVSSMSSEDLAAALQGYREDGDNRGLATLLDDLVATGRITEAQADAYYEDYLTEEKEDTTVKTGI